MYLLDWLSVCDLINQITASTFLPTISSSHSEKYFICPPISVDSIVRFTIFRVLVFFRAIRFLDDGGGKYLPSSGLKGVQLRISRQIHILKLATC